jgi:hypothetical protein
MAACREINRKQIVIENGGLTVVWHIDKLS